MTFLSGLIRLTTLALLLHIGKVCQEIGMRTWCTSGKSVPTCMCAWLCLCVVLYVGVRAVWCVEQYALLFLLLVGNFFLWY